MMVRMRHQMEVLLASEDAANAVTAILRWREVIGRNPYRHPDDETAAVNDELTAEDMQQEFRAFAHTVQARTSGFQRFMEVETGDLIIDYLADLDLGGEYGKVRTIDTGNAAFVVTAKPGRTGTLAILVDSEAWGDEEKQDWDYLATAAHLETANGNNLMVNDGQDFLSIVSEAATAEELVYLINFDADLPFTAALAEGSDGSGAVQSWRRRVIGAVPKEDARVEVNGRVFVQKNASRELLEAWDVQNENGGLLKTLLLAPAK